MSDEPGELTPEQEKAIRVLASDLHRLNNAVVAVVDAGVSVELLRTSRYHNEGGAWGDMMVPIIRPASHD